MANIFIFHGVGGHPQENWFPWLQKELKALGHNLFIPQFPTPDNQTLDQWLNVLDSYQDKFNEDTILIGHSLGVPFCLNVLEKYSAKAAFLVAGFVGKAENEFDEGMKTFAQREFDWKQIKEHCQQYKIYHSDNDPYISLDKPQRIADQLKVEITVVPGAGHFNESAGYTTFDLLLSDIEQFL